MIGTVGSFLSGVIGAIAVGCKTRSNVEAARHNYAYSNREKFTLKHLMDGLVGDDQQNVGIPLTWDRETWTEMLREMCNYQDNQSTAYFDGGEYFGKDKRFSTIVDFDASFHGKMEGLDEEGLRRLTSKKGFYWFPSPKTVWTCVRVDDAPGSTYDIYRCDERFIEIKMTTPKPGEELGFVAQVMHMEGVMHTPRRINSVQELKNVYSFEKRRAYHDRAAMWGRFLANSYCIANRRQ